MSGRLHIVDNDDLSGYKIYEEARRDVGGIGESVWIPVLVRHGASFSRLQQAHEYVTTHNDRIDKELLP